MFLFVLYSILAIIYSAVPLFAKLLVFILNIFIKDPLPAVDEVFMLLSILRNIAIWNDLNSTQKALRIIASICLVGICIVILFHYNLL